MKKCTSLLLLAIIACLTLSAQYNTPENMFWAFGHKGGINFSSGAPVATATRIMTDEGSASVCDVGGNLLFYTDGDTLRNRDGDVMPGGASIVSFAVTSSSQGALIMPMPIQENQYYVFSLEERGMPGKGRLAYCIVDMTLDGGKGDLVAGTKQTMIDSMFTEKMIAIRGNGNNFWLLAMRLDTNLFYAYNVDGAGISATPVISTAGPSEGYETYVMKCSPDRRRIAVTKGPAPPDGYGIELFSFDPATGVVSNFQPLSSAESYYGCEFSPDNTKLYVQQATPTSEILQYDISLPSLAEIKASRFQVAFSTTIMHTDMRLAPNGKIYFKSLNSGISSSYLDCINTPNNAGAACGCTSKAIFLGAGKIRYGLPNPTWRLLNTPAATSQPAPAQAVGLYPNPAHNELVIESAAPISSLIITDAAGRVVMRRREHVSKLGIAHLLPGVYTITLNGNRHLRFVKE